MARSGSGARRRTPKGLAPDGLAGRRAARYRREAHPGPPTHRTTREIHMNERGYAVTGKVIARETGGGVSSLPVVLFEIDRRDAAWGASFACLQRTAEHGISDVPGRRLGSVLTGPDGRFALQFHDHACAPSAPCRGPDLLVLVLGQEGLQASNLQGSVLAATKILGAARKEAVILRVGVEQLTAAGVHGVAHERRAESVDAALEHAHALQTAVRQSTERHIARAYHRAVEPRKTATAALERFSLSRFAPSTRAGSSYVSHRASVAEKLDRAVEQRMKDIPERLDASISRTMRIKVVDPAALRNWGMLPDPNGAVTADVPFARVVELLRRFVTGGSMERSRSWLEIACAERKATREFEAALTRCTAAPSPDPAPSVAGPDAAPIDSSRIVREHLARQLAHVTAPEVELQYGVQQDNKITATIARPAPSDVTAYHDFHELQIAFEHLWSEAFDDKIPQLFRDVYAEMVKFSSKASGELTLPQVESVDDMKRLYQEFRSLQTMLRESDKEARVPLPVPERVKGMLPELTETDWGGVDPSSRAKLIAMADEYAGLAYEDLADQLEAAATLGDSRRNDANRMRELRDEARQIVSASHNHRAPPRKDGPPPRVTANPDGRPRAEGADTGNSRLDELFRELDQRLAEPYRFDVFARDSVNLGVMLTYRQKWVPRDYQVGSLVSTIPLAPKEVRRYSTKRVVKKTRSERELEDREQSSRTERNSTSRADAEIVRQAREKTAFETTAKGTINVGIFEGSFGTRFGVDAEKASSDTKKNFREAVLKAADEFRRKHTTEVQTSTSEEVEAVTSGEVSNPNDEITVTYLFYELQRQYEISELLHRLTPVVLVANDVPKPDEVDEDWLIAHRWILQRVLLDEALRPALEYLTSSIAGDQLALEAMRGSVERQIALVEQVTRQVAAKTKLAEGAFEELRALVQQARSPADAEKMQNIAMAMFLGPFALAAGTGDDEAAEKREEIAKMALERADQAASQISARLTREVTALQEAVDKYVEALRGHFDHALAISSLRIHVKQNILYYMQAIWDHEPTDQRYFRLYNVSVPWIVAASGNGLTLSATATPSSSGGYWLDASLPIANGASGTAYYEKIYRKLSEVADLDNLLGYKGNYMIFPAKEPSYLHLYMMQDYIDPESGGLRDPDGFSSLSSDEILEHLCCLQQLDPGFVERNRERLLAELKQRKASHRRESELVVVPTDSLYIEALPGVHPVMEPFKRAHRALDVKKVQSDVRHGEIENLRLAARLLAGEFEDPDIEKRIEVRGGANVGVDT
ncbi:hypothetical protein WME76_18195 [Sorangium sp. So ce119]|uniref:hypothetical protein n=1 Tax=Sorangium sp. So ce119 TaxID=3133279 RepID=UPI003F5F3374